MGNTGGQETPWQGVYRVNPDGSELTLLSDEFSAPNGLAFSPDEQRLYIDDSEDMLLRVFDVLPDGSLGAGKVLLTGMGSHESRRGVPDGLRVDAEGRVWMTGPDGIWVLTPDGEVIGLLPTPEVAANLVWGGPDQQTLYITGSTSLYRVQLNVTGAVVR
jgi:gluconolactonase